MSTLRAMPILQVSDVGKSLAFYARAGFGANGTWDTVEGGEIGFAIVQRGQVTLGLQLLRGPLRVNSHWGAYLYVDDIDAVHAEFAAEGLSPSAIERHVDYACDDFELTDPDGHRLAFGHDRSGEYGPGLGPEKGNG
ncbi:MAG: VOC family protein [Pseudomonadota bacterium]